MGLGALVLKIHSISVAMNDSRPGGLNERKARLGELPEAGGA